MIEIERCSSKQKDSELKVLGDPVRTATTRTILGCKITKTLFSPWFVQWKWRVLRKSLRIYTQNHWSCYEGCYRGLLTHSGLLFQLVLSNLVELVFNV